MVGSQVASKRQGSAGLIGEQLINAGDARNHSDDSVASCSLMKPPSQKSCATLFGAFIGPLLDFIGVTTVASNAG